VPAYYNEIDPYAAQWLRNLIAAGEIAPGDVDERSIVEVKADDIKGYKQCHFFAGIGGWSYALRLAGVPDDRFVWTGSCPCQPFSAAGQGKAGDDERHLWPAWLPLIAECRPPIVFGEQVAAAIGWGWVDLVFNDLEKEGYACAQAVLPACSVGAPHIRDRVWFVADADGWHASAEGLQRGGEQRQQSQDGGAGGLANAEPQLDRSGARGARGRTKSTNGSAISGLADARHGYRPARSSRGEHQGSPSVGKGSAGDCTARSVADDDRRGRPLEPPPRLHEDREPGHDADGRGVPGGAWSDIEWIRCTDGKLRPTQSGSFPLVDGASFRVGSGSAFEGKSRTKMLKGYGNAIVGPLGAEFIAAAMECMP
jgi:DNA (cytosine-5)-methyltransferase 1